MTTNWQRSEKARNDQRNYTHPAAIARANREANVGNTTMKAPTFTGLDAATVKACTTDPWA